MGKSKKKDKKKDFISDDDEDSVALNAAKNVADDVEDDLAVAKKMAKKNQKSKKKNAKQLTVASEQSDEDSVDDDVGSDTGVANGVVAASGKTAAKKSAKTKAKVTGFAALLMDDDDENEDSDGGGGGGVTLGRSRTGGAGGGFSALLMNSDSESDFDAAAKARSDSEDTHVVKDKKKDTKKKAKDKKKAKKKPQHVDDDADLDKMLSELSVEHNGDKAHSGHETATVSSAKTSETVEKISAGEQQKELHQQQQQQQQQMADEADEQVDADGTGKTKAQKRKEKKEREKQKKSTQPERKPNEPSPSIEELLKQTAMEEENKSKPGKPKKGKKPETEAPDEEEDSKSKRKGPGKKLVAAMQEALRQKQEAEERARRDEEEQLRREQEEEERRETEARKEKELKELKKKQAKQRRDQLKAEGKLLTAKEKQSQARAQALVEAMRAQSAQLAQQKQQQQQHVSAKDARKQRKKSSTTAAAEVTTQSTAPAAEFDEKKEAAVVEKLAASAVVEKENDPVKQEEEDVLDSWQDGVKDSWDQDSDSDTAADAKSAAATSATSTVAASMKPSQSQAGHSSKTASNKTPAAASHSSSNSSSSDDDDDDDDSSSEDDDDDDEEDEKDERSEAQRQRDRVAERIDRRRREARQRMSPDCLREPVICVLGHVDTGKTKILDKLRRTNVQEGEAGGITQQIGATNVPLKAIEEQQRLVRVHKVDRLKIPGLLIIDTPGHESFSNLRSRGSSLCDLAVLVVDIMHGLEPQTLESIGLLKQKKTPFVVALNKVDRLYDWQTAERGGCGDIEDIIAGQATNTRLEFDKRWQHVQTQLAEQGFNARLFYDNPNMLEYLSVVPTSAITGQGMANLMALVVLLTQTVLYRRLMYSDELQATVLEVKQIAGLGTTVDVILVNGTLKEGATIVLAGTNGPIVTQIRSLLMPQPMRELRVKNSYREFREVRAAQGVKIAAKELEHAIAGLNLLVAERPDEVEVCRALVNNELRSALRSIRLSERGVYVQASTLGSLEALIEFLRTSQIAYSGVRIGPVVKRDVMRASTQLEHDVEFACILAFDVRVERDAQELADQMSVRIFQADIIYHLFDKFTAYKAELRRRRREQFRTVAVFPCRLRVLPHFVFNSRDPIVAGVVVEAGVVRIGTPICVPSKEFLDIGCVASLEVNHKQVEEARRGVEVCVKIEPVGGDSPKMFGRHFDENDALVSRISRESIDACKNHFRDDLQKTDWQLMIELKKLFRIL